MSKKKVFRNSKKINRIIVSTDNQQIKRVAEKFGAEVPFMRPKKFSTSKSQNIVPSKVLAVDIHRYAVIASYN